MTEDNLGSGISLDQNLDFEVDSTGDIDTTSGIDELEKDLAFQMIGTLSQFLGETPTQKLQAKVINTAKAVALSDERIINVDEEEASVSFDRQNDEITLNLPVTTDTNENYELVFEV